MKWAPVWRVAKKWKSLDVQAGGRNEADDEVYTWQCYFCPGIATQMETTKQWWLDIQVLVVIVMPNLAMLLFFGFLLVLLLYLLCKCCLENHCPENTTKLCPIGNFDFDFHFSLKALLSTVLLYFDFYWGSQEIHAKSKTFWLESCLLHRLNGYWWFGLSRNETRTISYGGLLLMTKFFDVSVLSGECFDLENFRVIIRS